MIVTVLSRHLGEVRALKAESEKSENCFSPMRGVVTGCCDYTDYR